MSTILAIDPGAKGGLAWIDPLGIARAIRMPDTNGDVLAALRAVRAFASTVYLEHVVGFIPAGSPGNMFAFGENFGYLQGCLDALGFRVVRVRPQAWQKALALGGKGSKIKPDRDASPESKKLAQQHNSGIDREWKNKLKGEAQRRFPALKVTLDTADALLLLDYARQQPGSSFA